MDAKEARRKALEFNTNEANEKYLKVMSAINHAADRGEYSIRVDFNITGDLETKLKYMGYGLKNDGSSCKISW
jgi:hypothetical protein